MSELGSIMYGTVTRPVRSLSSAEKPLRAPGHGRHSIEMSSSRAASRTLRQNGEPSYSCSHERRSSWSSETRRVEDCGLSPCAGYIEDQWLLWPRHINQQRRLVTKRQRTDLEAVFSVFHANRTRSIAGEQLW